MICMLNDNFRYGESVKKNSRCSTRAVDKTMKMSLDICCDICYNTITIKSARGTAPVTARQPALSVRWQWLNDGRLSDEK